jgi:pilus assembly protein CpaF
MVRFRSDRKADAEREPDVDPAAEGVEPPAEPAIDLERLRSLNGQAHAPTNVRPASAPLGGLRPASAPPAYAWRPAPGGSPLPPGGVALSAGSSVLPADAPMRAGTSFLDTSQPLPGPVLPDTPALPRMPEEPRATEPPRTPSWMPDAPRTSEPPQTPPWNAPRQGDARPSPPSATGLPSIALTSALPPPPRPAEAAPRSAEADYRSAEADYRPVDSVADPRQAAYPASQAASHGYLPERGIEPVTPAEPPRAPAEAQRTPVESPVMFLPPSVVDAGPRALSAAPGSHPGQSAGFNPGQSAGFKPGQGGGYNPGQGGGPPGGGRRPRHAAPAPTSAPVDYAAVRALGKQISERLSLWLRNHGDANDDQRRRERDRMAGQAVAEWVDAQRRAGVPLAAFDESALLEAVIADLVGLGRLQALLADPSIEEVHILGCDRVRITRRTGAVEIGAPIADSDEEMVEILQTAARRAGSTERSLSTSRPVLDLQLPDGSRLAAVYQVSHRPYAVIRRHNTLDVTLPDLAGGRGDLSEMIDPLMGEFLSAAMRAGLNIMVAGLAGAGKTTLLRALAAEIPRQEAFVVLEESRELGLHKSPRHPWAMSFEAREGHGERDLAGRPAGEVSIADLIPLSLRMGVLRVIVGEVRSREIVPMLQAMTTSRGSMCTIHARTPSAVTERIIELALSHGKDMTVELARRMAGNALDLVVYVMVQDETAIGGRKHRYVSHIEEVDGVTGDRIATTTVFGPGVDGRGVPKHLPGRVRDHLLRVGYDSRALSGWIEAGHGAWRRPLQSLITRLPNAAGATA